MTQKVRKITSARSGQSEHLNVVAVLSGNWNFEARIHPLVRAAYLASPPLVVAYALAGTVRRDLTTEPIGYVRDGKPVFLRDLWPSPAEVEDVVQTAIRKEMFGREYATIFQGDEQWQQVEVSASATCRWEPDSTYIREPPFFTHAQCISSKKMRPEGERGGGATPFAQGKQNLS